MLLCSARVFRLREIVLSLCTSADPFVAAIDPVLQVGAVPFGEAPVGRTAGQVGENLFLPHIGDNSKRR